jgi:hypothetical protein
MGKGIDDIPQVCLECKQQCCNRRSLGNHVNRSHKELGGLHGYVLKHMLSGVVPICLCGCGEDVAWHKQLYRFNDYVNGHNAHVEGHGYCVSGYRATVEQIARRNDSIKDAYATRGEEINAKISVSVVEAFKDPAKHANLMVGLKKAWRSPERRAQARVRAIDMLSKGLIGPHAPFKTCWHDNPFTGKEEFMHSSWETAFLNACIKSQYPVTKEHGIEIPYVAPDGTDHVYLPDFKALEENVLFEVKGHMRGNDEAKLSACRSWCLSNGFELVVIGSP